MHTFAAMIFAWAGRHDAAFEAARHALTLDRDHFQAHAVCGHLHDVTGRPDAALESYRTAYRLSAGNVFMPSTTHRDERRRGWCWADLMRRVFAFDVLACPRCGGRLRLIALIETSAATARILRHLGLPTEVPAPRPSRAPPSDWAA